MNLNGLTARCEDRFTACCFQRYHWYLYGHAAECDGRVRRIVEKPDSPPSEFVVTGIYFYDSDVFDVIPTLKPSGRGELEITDVNNHYISDGTMEYDIVEGFWGDAGESIEAYYAVNDFVRAHGANRR